MISFQKVNNDNLRDCIKIDTGIDEKYLPPVVYQIALSYVYPTKIPMAIYDDDKLIGFVSYEKDLEPQPAYDILVFVIDKQLQGKGCGTKALLAFIDYLKSFDDCSLITLNYNRENAAAHKLYTKVGFKPTGSLNPNNDEIIMKLKILEET